MSKHPAKHGGCAAEQVEPEPCSVPELITGDQALANHCGVSTKTVQNWRGKGLPCTDTGRGFVYDLAEVERFRETLKSQTSDSTDAVEAKERILAAEARIKEAEAVVKEIDAEQKRGNVLPRDELTLALSLIIRETTVQLGHVPNRFAMHLCPTCQPKAFRELREVIEHALTQLSTASVDSLTV